MPPRLDAVPELDEAQATVLRWYEPLVVPGLLQTGDYARAILSARPGGNLSDLDEQVAARLARQAILDRTGVPQLWCILDEGVLHRAIGGTQASSSAGSPGRGCKNSDDQGDQVGGDLV